MSKRKPDRRVLRTRKQLREAFMALILEDGYDAVTIEDITERADLGRTTFYLHYKDKEDLLYKSLEAVFDDLVQQIDLQPIEEVAHPGQALSMMAFQHAAENAHLYKIILSGQGGTAIDQRIREYIAQNAMRVMQTHYAQHVADSPIPLEVIANYIGSSMLGMITWWLENDQPYTTAEMYTFFQQLNFRGIVHAMGMTPVEDLFSHPGESTIGER